MPSLVTKIILFFSSYLPLWLIFAVQFYTKNNKTGAIVSVSIALMCMTGLSVYLRYSKRLNPVPLKIIRLNRKDGEAMSYIVSYLLPFVALPSGTVGDLVSLALFICVLAVLYVNSDMIHINPVLNLMGWHLYEIEKESGTICMVMSKNKLRNNTEIEAGQIGEDLFVVN